MALLLLLAVSWTSVSSFLIIDAEPGIQVGREPVLTVVKYCYVVLISSKTCVNLLYLVIIVLISTKTSANYC